MNPLEPTPNLLSKLGSIAVHIQEYLSQMGHPFDEVTLRSLLSDPEVKEWLEAMDELALLPVKR